jgi:hypothetical protein
VFGGGGDAARRVQHRPRKIQYGVVPGQVKIYASLGSRLKGGCSRRLRGVGGELRSHFVILGFIYISGHRLAAANEAELGGISKEGERTKSC